MRDGGWGREEDAETRFFSPFLFFLPRSEACHSAALMSGCIEREGEREGGGERETEMKAEEGLWWRCLFGV